MKRFSESTKWADPWFRALPIESKCLWLWLLDNCDCAGIIEPDMHLAAFQIGSKEGLQSPLQALGDRVQSYGTKLFIPKFIRYQYGAELSITNSAHRGVISRLEMAKIPCPVMIIESTNKAPAKGLPRGYQAPQDKDMDKDKEKDAVKDSIKGKKEKKSIKPSLQELEEYMTSKGLTKNDAEWLHDKWEGNGYRNGGKPIVSWQATIRTWQRVGDIFPSQKQKRPTGNFGVKKTDYGDRSNGDRATQEQIDNFLM